MDNSQRDLVLVARCVDTMKILYKIAPQVKNQEITSPLRKSTDELLSSILMFANSGESRHKESIAIQLGILEKILLIYKHLKLLPEFETLVAIRSILRLKKAVASIMRKASVTNSSKSNKANEEIKNKKIIPKKEIPILKNPDGLNEIQIDILKLIEDRQKIGIQEMYLNIKDVTPRTIRRNIIPLVDDGHIDKISEGREVFYAVKK